MTCQRDVVWDSASHMLCAYIMQPKFVFRSSKFKQLPNKTVHMMGFKFVVRVDRANVSSMAIVRYTLDTL